MYQADGLIHSDTNCQSFKKTANIFAQTKKLGHGSFVG